MRYGKDRKIDPNFSSLLKILKLSEGQNKWSFWPLLALFVYDYVCMHAYTCFLRQEKTSSYQWCLFTIHIQPHFCSSCTMLGNKEVFPAIIHEIIRVCSQLWILQLQLCTLACFGCNMRVNDLAVLKRCSNMLKYLLPRCVNVGVLISIQLTFTFHAVGKCAILCKRVCWSTLQKQCRMVYHFPLIQSRSSEMWVSMCCFHTETCAHTIVLWFQHKAAYARKCANCQVWHVNLLWRKYVRSSSAAGWSQNPSSCRCSITTCRRKKPIVIFNAQDGKAFWDVFFCTSF